MTFIRIVCAALSMLIAFWLPYTPPESKCDPKFNGTFVQSWLTMLWDDEQWQTEIAYMKAAGIETLILQDMANETEDGTWEVFYNSDLEFFDNAYVSDIDVIEAALRNCEGSGIKVYIGLALHQSWFITGGADKDYTNACSLMADMVEEIYGKYYAEYPDTFSGWYFTPEIWSNIVNVCSLSSVASGLNAVLDRATQVSPGLPMILSPFMFENSSCHKALLALPMWINFFNKVHFRDDDIFCPQDGVGCDIAKLDTIEQTWRMYAKAIESSKADVRLWANCESFTTERKSQKGVGRFIAQNAVDVTSTLDRFTQQMQIASRYAENIITFSYNHYYSPQAVNTVFNDTYLDYLANGCKLEHIDPSAPTNFTASRTKDGIELDWNASRDNIGIAYYRICANGKFLARVEAEFDCVPTHYTDTSAHIGAVAYTIEAVDGAGNTSFLTAARG